MRNDSFIDFLHNKEYGDVRNMYAHNRSFRKEYPRFNCVRLPFADKLEMTIGDVLTDRKSSEGFSETPLTLKNLSTILYWSVGIHKNKKHEHRTYPSGGALYPLETYLFSINCKELDSGLYHYDAHNHKLAHIETVSAPSLLNSFAFSSKEKFKNTSVVVLLSCVKERFIHKYGQFGYKLALLEAGHIGQNIYLSTQAVNCGSRAMGFKKTEEIGYHMEFDGINEFMLYGVALGNTLT